MKQIGVSVGIVLAVMFAAEAQAAFEQQLVFPLQEKHVHASSIVECPNGDLLCCWFYGSGERKSKDVLIQGARLKAGSTKWSSVFLMADTPEVPDCNPVLYIDAKQELWLFWMAVPAEQWEDSLLRYRKSRDFQKAGAPKWYWQDDMILDPGEKFVESLVRGYDTVRRTTAGFDGDFGGLTTSAHDQLLAAARDLSKRQRGWMTRTSALTLPSGRIVLPLYSDGYYLGLMALSDDGGATWRASSPIVGACLNQPSVARKRDGTLVAYMREEGELNRKGRALRSESKDDGETWSVAEYTDIPNPNASLEVLALKDGRWVLVYNDTEKERNSLALSLSDDEGATWKWTRHLEHAPKGAFHYPSIIQSRDGRIHVSYTYNNGEKAGKSIKHVALDPDWIKAEDLSKE